MSEAKKATATRPHDRPPDNWKRALHSGTICTRLTFCPNNFPLMMVWKDEGFPRGTVEGCCPESKVLHRGSGGEGERQTGQRPTAEMQGKVPDGSISIAIITTSIIIRSSSTWLGIRLCLRHPNCLCPSRSVSTPPSTDTHAQTKTHTVIHTPTVPHKERQISKQTNPTDGYRQTDRQRNRQRTATFTATQKTKIKQMERQRDNTITTQTKQIGRQMKQTDRRTDGETDMSYIPVIKNVVKVAEILQKSTKPEGQCLCVSARVKKRMYRPTWLLPKNIGRSPLLTAIRPNNFTLWHISPIGKHLRLEVSGNPAEDLQKR